MGWFFSKPRSRFGKWLDDNGIEQRWLAKKSGISEVTISNLASGKINRPTTRVWKSLLSVLRSIDPHVNYRDFWM